MSLIIKENQHKKFKVLQLTDQALPALVGCAIDYVGNGFIVSQKAKTLRSQTNTTYSSLIVRNTLLPSSFVTNTACAIYFTEY